MSDELVLYPPELPTDVANIVDNAHCLDLRRMGRGSKVVHRVNLTAGGKPVSFGTRSERSDDELAAELWTHAEEDAEKHAKGRALYRVTANYAKPPQGTTASPQSFELRIGSDERSEAEHKSDLLSQLMAERRELFKQHVDLLSGTTKLANAVSSMVIGLSNALANVNERERAVAENATELRAIDAQAAADRERSRMFDKMLGPAIAAFQKKMGIAPAQPALPAGIIGVARELGSSFTVAQLEHAATTLGSGRMSELASVENEAELLNIVTWMLSIEMEKTMQVHAKLTDAQVPKVEQLIAWATAKGDELERERAAASSPA